MAKPHTTATKMGSSVDPADLPPLTEEDYKALTTKISAARVGMLYNNKFFGIVALKLGMEISDEIPTACTDGRRILFNPHFIKDLTHQEMIFLYAHEVWHVVFEHFLRLENRVPEWYNMAGDYVINGLLKRDKIGTPITKIPILLDHKYDNMSTEQVYALLEKQNEAFKDTLDVHIHINEDDSGDQQDDDGGAGDQDGDGDGDPKDGDGKSKDGDGKPKDGKGGKLTRVSMSKAEISRLRREIQGTIIQAAQTAGNVPGEIQRLIDDFLASKVNWRDLLRVSIESKIKYDSSFSRPDRKSWSNGAGFILPGGMPGEAISVGISCDNSGSISDQMLKEMLSEVNGIMENYQDFVIKLWCFDTRVSGYAEFNEENREELGAYKFTGGGGTAIACNWEYIEKNDIEMDLFVCFTDLYSGDLHEINPNTVDTVWIVVGSREKPPFGRYAYYEDGVARG